MSTTQQKIKYGLKNVHYAVVTENGDGSITYGTPKRLPGGVSLTLTPNGELFDFPADDIIYWSTEVNNGYDGEIELADIPDSFRTEVLGEELSADGVLYESANAKGKQFALMYEVSTDVKARRGLLYHCTATRPNANASTKSGSTIEPQTSSLTFQARPRPTDLLIKAQTTVSADEEVYNAWYTEVHEKTVTPPNNEQQEG